ncbi:hypothetical protein A5904_14525 (plasmid) [Acidithiobacillus caldus]|jgi:hypothetical protein|uniref:Uncharacterized protein n=2 Tax=Acidithiobacillus caldus TaxID=33059 RepID=F9ZU33_ACICS|nr:hypothetical protein [Acidithiobacillus caldus]AEK59653.1 conserved hypothetical protein [Acidithiobacillus caldus SM-1]AUW34162.1 hypothetical protein A5904_14525 [Acidithiobacillus caldus]MBU2735750.1 hypothetical protein [Acidithiobacillus caldus ATCC 51756]MBU2801640.1 hypothetical protein [Acidithiobacillus caldus]OFC34912.1 hypothetical protein BAE28_11870 [Acidithiobacillus caldus]
MRTQNPLSRLIDGLRFDVPGDLAIADQIEALAPRYLPRHRAQKVIRDIRSLRALHEREVAHV